MIFWARADALGHIVPQAMMQMERLTDGLEQLQLTYRPSLGGLDETDSPIDDSEWTARMLKALQNLRSREIAAGLGYSAVQIDAMTADGVLYAEADVARLPQD